MDAGVVLDSALLDERALGTLQSTAMRELVATDRGLWTSLASLALPPGLALLGLLYARGSYGLSLLGLGLPPKTPRSKWLLLACATALGSLLKRFLPSSRLTESSFSALSASQTLLRLVRGVDGAGWPFILSGVSPRRLTRRQQTKDLMRNTAALQQYEHLTWQAVSEFLVFVLPFIRPPKVLAWISRVRRGVGRSLASLIPQLQQSTQKPHTKLSISSKDSIPTTCLYCTKASRHSQQHNIQNPWKVVPCGHIYCYYCIASAAASESSSLECLTCGVGVTDVVPLDVVSH